MTIQRFSFAEFTVQLQSHPEVWSPLSAIELLKVLMGQGYLQDLDGVNVLDFGTGSGIVGIVCGLLGAQDVTLSDYCSMAAVIAVQNAQLNGLTNVTGVQSDRFAQLGHQHYDLIISNPPVQPWLYTNLSDQEHRARVEAWNEAGADGRLVLDSLLCDAHHHLQPGGRLITSTSSRHGWRKTQRLLEQHWPGHWQAFYRSEHPILPDYHGPYLQSWLEMQTHDLDLRVYQKDEQGRPFAVYTNPQGETQLLIGADCSLNTPPICWQQREGRWQPLLTEPQAASAHPKVQLALSPTEAEQLITASKSGTWYYTYHLLEAIKPERD
ncbi:MAG: methyltransferase [Cyanobacteria bacterium P01_G01_bin.54]